VKPPPEGATPTVWRALWTSRLVVLFAGIAGVIQVGVAAGATAAYDPDRLTAPWGYLANAVAAPLARWDSVWYLTIAKAGYAGNVARMAFFPLYPLLIHVVGFVTQSDLVAGVLISLVAFAVGLWLLYRLVRLDFSDEIAEMTVMLLAFCPMSFFFSAVYTESLFLALSVGSIYAARRERWLLAGALGGLAAMSRNGGVALIVPIAVIYLYGPRTTAGARPTRWAGEQLSGLRLLLPRYRLRPSAFWLLLIPAGLGAYLAYLGIEYGHALAPFNAEQVWYRHSTFPLTTIWRAAEQAWNGLRQLVHGPTPPYYVPAYAQSVTGAALQDVYLFAFLILGVLGLIGAARRLPVAYSLYTLAMLVLALADPVSLQPLASLPRYEMVVFPFFIWGAQFVTRHRLKTPAIASLAVMLGLFTVEFATWRWVA
jgi:hypothetical protein